MKKNIIITGGTRGIGKSTAKMLLNDVGNNVYICSRSNDDLKTVEDEFGNSENLHTFVLDLSDKEAIKAFTDSWDQPLYGLINSAGICQTEFLSEDNPDVWESVLKVNLTAPMLLVKGLHRRIVDWGRIINISSQLGKEGRSGYSAYCASKFGLIGLTKTWAHELGVRGITVNAICPGWVATEMSLEDVARIAKKMGYSYNDYYKKICAQLELKRFTEPQEVSNLISFLLSEEASGITGRDWLMNVIWNQN